MMSQSISRLITLSRITFAATVVALLVFTAANASATTSGPTGPTGADVIYECVNNSSGTTHILTPAPNTVPDPATACHKNETLYTIEGVPNSTNLPTDETGATGVTGATG